MEAEWSADRANLRLAVREHPEWSAPQLAQQFGGSVSWVKQWRQRGVPHRWTMRRSCTVGPARGSIRRLA